MNTQASGNKKRGAAEKSGKGGAVDVPGKKKKKEKFDRKVRHKRTILGFFLLRLLSFYLSLSNLPTLFDWRAFAQTMIKHVRRLLKIVLPGLWSKEA